MTRRVPMIGHDTEVANLHIAYERTAWYDNAMAILGTKDDPTTLSKYNVQMHPDGAYMEFASISPYYCVEDMIQAISFQKRALESLCEFELQGEQLVDMRAIPDIEQYPALYKSVTTFGCSPDFQRGKVRMIPDWVGQSPFREGGFHVHINLRPEYAGNARKCAPLVDELSRSLMVWHLEELANVPPDYRHWYRKPGVYRPKPYGLEYRSLSSSIINDQAKLVSVLNTIWDFQMEHLNTAEVFI